MSSASSTDSGRSAAESVTTATRRRAAWCAMSCCRCMSSAFSLPTAPNSAARANSRGGSLVWMCRRTLLRVPATTRLEPSSDACSRRRRRSIASPVIVHSVHQRCSRSTCEPAVSLVVGQQLDRGVVRRRDAGLEVVGHAGDELDEAERAGVHDVGAPQHLELPGRRVERDARGGERTAQQQPEVSRRPRALRPWPRPRNPRSR